MGGGKKTEKGVPVTPSDGVGMRRFLVCALEGGRRPLRGKLLESIASDYALESGARFSSTLLTNY